MKEFLLVFIFIPFVDVLGRDTEVSANQLLLYIYEDGSVEKRVTLGD